MSMLRAALESEEEEQPGEQSIVMKGPLAEIYTNALNVAYAKDDPLEVVEQTAALESAAIDVMMAQQLAKAMSTDEDSSPTDAFQTVYGVSKDAVSDEIIVDVTSELASPERNGEFALIIDGTQPGDNSTGTSLPEERMVELSAVLEGLVEAHGGKVYRSLKEFGESRK